MKLSKIFTEIYWSKQFFSNTNNTSLAFLLVEHFSNVIISSNLLKAPLPILLRTIILILDEHELPTVNI